MKENALKFLERTRVREIRIDIPRLGLAADLATAREGRADLSGSAKCRCGRTISATRLVCAACKADSLIVLPEK